ncbi:MAG: type II toxin-antitoxin system HipA family toxin [Steroidobacteraceae bacterium]
MCLGDAGKPMGTLTYVNEGRREYSAYAYDAAWLGDPARFEVSPDWPLVEGHQLRRAPYPEDSCFPFAIADTSPDAWGQRVIRRAHVKRREAGPSLPALTAFDFLAAVDDYSRVGALRLQDARGGFLRSADEQRTPPLIELERIYMASRAVEEDRETAADLAYLEGKGTSLGGLRPKCTVLEDDGSLAIGKFPSTTDERSIPRGEVLALALARNAGIEAATARVVDVDGVPIAVIRRFDRIPGAGRIPYLSAGSLLQAGRGQDRTYTELLDTLRRVSARPREDAHELWRRLVFNLLITNVDDHLWNLGVLYVSPGQWKLAPAFDLNPFPERQRESKTWLSEQSGPITTVAQLVGEADYFGLTPADAKSIVAHVAHATRDWRRVAVSVEVGLQESELGAFRRAFEHVEITAAQAFCA